jgi:hypothetical protein
VRPVRQRSDLLEHLVGIHRSRVASGFPGQGADLDQSVVGEQTADRAVVDLCTGGFRGWGHAAIIASRRQVRFG